MVSENQPKKKKKEKITFYNHHEFVQTWKLSQFVLRVNSVDANIEILCKTRNPIFPKRDPERERERERERESKREREREREREQVPPHLNK
jgi:hypothetical protein